MRIWQESVQSAETAPYAHLVALEKRVDLNADCTRQVRKRALRPSGTAQTVKQMVGNNFILQIAEISASIRGD